jgi:hypothetical protein
VLVSNATDGSWPARQQAERATTVLRA